MNLIIIPCTLLSCISASILSTPTSCEKDKPGNPEKMQVSRSGVQPYLPPHKRRALFACPNPPYKQPKVNIPGPITSSCVKPTKLEIVPDPSKEELAHYNQKLINDLRKNFRREIEAEEEKERRAFSKKRLDKIAKGFQELIETEDEFMKKSLEVAKETFEYVQYLFEPEKVDVLKPMEVASSKSNGVPSSKPIEVSN